MTRRSLARVLLQPLAIAIGLAAVARVFVQFYAIPSESMAPTLLAGDRVIVTRYWFGAPSTGDVVVFRSPVDGSLLVKRVVAGAGELVESRQGRLFIGGQAVAEPYVADPASTGPIQSQLIPESCYFVLGDNRAAAVDSRTLGPIPRTLIVGRARMIVWHRDGRSGTRPVRIFKCVR